MLLRKKEEIEVWLNKYDVINYELIEEEKYGYVVNVNNDVKLNNKNLTSIDIKFNEIKGNFTCSENELTSLEGGPNIVKGSFFCSKNKLSTLDGCPRIIKGDFICNNNKINTLKYFPEIITESFSCTDNKLISLEGIKNIGKHILINHNKINTLKHLQKIINGDLNCGYNNIKTLIDGPDEINGTFFCYNNNLVVESLKDLFKNLKVNYLDISSNKKLGHLQEIDNLEKLKEKVEEILNIKTEKDNLLNIINKEDLNKNKTINKI